MATRSAEPFTILVQSHKCRTTLIAGELSLEFRLASAFVFAERHFVRLFAAAGLEEAVLVKLSFASLSPYDNSFGRLLAVAAPTAHASATAPLPGPLVEVEGNFISSLNSLVLAKTNGEAFEKVPDENLCLCLQVLPESHVGAHGGPRV